MKPPFAAFACRSLAVLALAAAVALAACGGGGSTTADGERLQTTLASGGSGAGASGGGKAGGSPKPGGRPSCETQLGDLLGSLDSLRVRLATGFSYEQYAGAVRRARAAYAALDAGSLAPACVLAAGTDAEKSLNRYIEAANTWGECLADAGCDGRAVEPELQRQWQVASHWLSRAHEGLERVS